MKPDLQFQALDVSNSLKTVSDSLIYEDAQTLNINIYSFCISTLNPSALCISFHMVMLDSRVFPFTSTNIYRVSIMCQGHYWTCGWGMWKNATKFWSLDNFDRNLDRSNGYGVKNISLIFFKKISLILSTELQMRVGHLDRTTW